MAGVGDTTVELALLQSRFPGEAVELCGRIRSDFFCARRKEECSYEGRLFVMDRALLFVSTHSSEYDLFVNHGDIEQITVLQRVFLPSISLSLPHHKEMFTNFHNLSGLVELLKTLELPPPVLSVPPLAPSIQRMASVPSTVTTHNPTHPTVEQCPFFVRGGFCPRRPLCKLDHSQQPSNNPSTSQSATNLTGDPSKISPGSQTSSLPKYTPVTVIGRPKRFHPMEDGGENPSINSLSKNAVASTTVALDTVSSATGSVATEKPTGRRSTARSVSLPVTDARCKRGGAERKGAWPRGRGPRVVPTMTSSSQGALGGGGGRESELMGKTTSTDDKTTSSELAAEEGLSPLGQSSSPVVPKVFDFSGRSDGECGEGGRGEGGKGEGVFVFTASPGKTGEVGEEEEEGEEGEEEVKKKPQLWPASTERRGEGERGGGSQNEVVAELAQQLQLDSDSDSIHGDLDVETQRKILDSLSPHCDQEPGPSHRATGHHSSPMKRRPCVYFLSGFCRNGFSCPDYHGLDFDPSELDDIHPSDIVGGDQEPAVLPREVKVYHADHAHIGSGDKIILSPEVLVACEQQQLSYPVAFRLAHPTSGESVFCGVLQFTAPSRDSAHLPSWMMDHLQARDGDVVSFSHVDLPKGTFVRLQPVSSAWLGIPYDKRMAMMEFQLRNFQTLTEGTKVTLTYELNRYTLKVLQCKPARGISILNADITTDITEPADLSRYHSVVEGQAEHIGLGETVSCSVPSGSYRHFVLLSLPGKPLPPRVCVAVKMKKGDPDLFLCQTCTAPSQSRYTWCSQEVGDSCIHLTTDNEEEYDMEKPLYAGVVSLCEDSDFTVSFNTHSPPLFARGGGHSAMATGQTLRDSSHLPKATPTPEQGSPSLEDTDGASLPAGQESCLTCGQVMPSLRLVMHQRHCAISSFTCPHCRAVLPKVAEKKHKYIAHHLLVCACGLEFTQFALHCHQKTDCSKRMMPCQFKWCNLSFPMDQLMEHEGICGRKTRSCCLCQEEVSQLEMAIHLEAFHSVDTRDLDWTKPLQREDVEARVSRPQLSCGCGLGFDFQDDMEVHQLTDCPLRRLSEHQPLPPTEGEIVG